MAWRSAPEESWCSPAPTMRPRPALPDSLPCSADAVPRFGHASTDKLISEAAHLSALRRATSVVGRGFDTFLRWVEASCGRHWQWCLALRNKVSGELACVVLWKKWHRGPTVQLALLPCARRRVQHQRSLARQATLERGLSIVDCMKAPVQLYPAGTKCAGG